MSFTCSERDRLAGNGPSPDIPGCTRCGGFVTLGNVRRAEIDASPVLCAACQREAEGETTCRDCGRPVLPSQAALLVKLRQPARCGECEAISGVSREWEMEP